MMGIRLRAARPVSRHLAQILDLVQSGRLMDALTLVTTRIEDDPEQAELYCQRANILFKLRRMTAAELDCRHALALDDKNAQAWIALGCIMVWRFDRHSALQAFQTAMRLAPDSTGLTGAILTQQHYLACPPPTPQWQSICTRLSDDLANGDCAVAAFASLFCLGSPQAQLQAAKLEVQRHFPRPVASAARDPARSASPHRRIRVGYVSPHFHTHPLLMLMAGIFECHDRKRFEIFAIATGLAPASDPYRRRLANSAEHVLDVSDALEDSQLIQKIRALDLDVVFDLDGHTRGGRPGVFSSRVAPVQISWLGHIGTTGMQTMDYVVADPVALPEESRHWMTERVIDMPVCYQANDTWRPISVWTPSRRACGLPRSGFVFCCHNQVYKITPPMFDAWMQILHAVANSILWLFEPDEQIRSNLRQRAQTAGIEPDRLVFAGIMPYAQYLARYRHADLFLDTHPYNAGATCSDALWSGLPVLTLAGKTFASRMGASLLHAVGLTDLVVDSEQAYVQRAIELARTPDRLKALRKHLQQIRSQHPLYDSALQTRWLESAIVQTVQRHRQGSAPAAFVVTRTDLCNDACNVRKTGCGERFRRKYHSPLCIGLAARKVINRLVLRAGDVLFAILRR